MNPIEAGNPDLVKAMHEIALRDGLENRERLYYAMLESMFVVPIPGTPSGLQPGMNTLAKDAGIQMIILNDNNGTKITPIFTGVDALRNWHGSVPYIGLRARDLFNIVLGTQVQEIAVNPFDPARKMTHPGGRIKRQEFELLAKGVIPMPPGSVVQMGLKAGEQVMIGIPAKRPPEEVERTLASTAETIPEIAELYLFQMAAQREGQWSPDKVIGILLTDDPHEKATDEIVRQLGSSIQAKMPLGEALNFMVLKGDFGQTIRARGILLFRRT